MFVIDSNVGDELQEMSEKSYSKPRCRFVPVAGFVFLGFGFPFYLGQSPEGTGLKRRG